MIGAARGPASAATVHPRHPEVCLRAHRLFMHDDVALLRSARTELATLALDDDFLAAADQLARKVEEMLVSERRDGLHERFPRFTWEDVALLEQLATRFAEHDDFVGARHWRSLVGAVREELRMAEGGTREVGGA